MFDRFNAPLYNRVGDQWASCIVYKHYRFAGLIGQRQKAFAHRVLTRRATSNEPETRIVAAVRHDNGLKRA
jgi:hypothetical protein